MLSIQNTVKEAIMGSLPSLGVKHAYEHEAMRSDTRILVPNSTVTIRRNRKTRNVPESSWLGTAVTLHSNIYHPSTSKRLT